MAYEVIVVGAGLGGLTTAALLAARGVSVCLIEKESSVGGCAAGFQKFGYDFELGAGLYSSWQPGEIHERIFAELPVGAPEVRRLSPAYVVRLPDHTEISIAGSVEEFETSLREGFPECQDAAIKFYRELASGGGTEGQTVAQQLTQTSLRFRRFIGAQLQTLIQCDSELCAYPQAAEALLIPRRGVYAIRGGAAALADSLLEAVRKSGGTVRLDTTALRLAYDSGGRAIGVDLLSGERVLAARAIVSNLTVWDTYGKLVGLNRTPTDVRSGLKNLQGRGAYLLFSGLEEEAAAELPADHVLAVTDWGEEESSEPEEAEFMFAAAPAWDPRAPAGRRAVTVSVFTDAAQWFAFHEDEGEHEEQDQMMLEALWERIHKAMPELGSRAEVIETMTPRDFYRNTRRKLGMVGGVNPSLSGPDAHTYRTTLPNLFMVGDTVFPGHGVAAVARCGFAVANEIAPPIKR
ncbi:MAG TPA: NAD(P)/FAD-dependent oxidoreductase [Pyrinomonadaceae bacterium]